MGRYRAALWVLVLAVTAAHLWLADVAGSDRFGLGAGTPTTPARMRVAFVRELKVAPPAALSAATPVATVPALAPRQEIGRAHV